MSIICLASDGRPVLRPCASLRMGFQTWVREAGLTHHPGQNGSGMVMWPELSHLDTLPTPGEGLLCSWGLLAMGIPRASLEGDPLQKKMRWEG